MAGTRAAAGLRPIGEILYSDWITIGMDQLVNQIAKIRYMFGGKVRAGKVRYIVASNYTASQLTRAIMLSQAHGWARFDCLQPEYSLLVR